MQKMLKNNAVQCVFGAAASYVSILAILHFNDGVYWVFSSGSSALLFWLCLGCFYMSALRRLNPRLWRTGVAGGAVLAVFQSLGEMILTQFGAARLPVKLLGYAFLYTAVLCRVFAWAEERGKTPQKASPVRDKLDNIFSGQRKSLFVLGGALLVCWLPYYVVNWPGLISLDNKFQLGMWVGQVALNSHHPVLHTAFLGLSAQLGRLLGSEALGIGVGTFLQMAALALAVSAALRQMARLQARLVWRVGAFLFYALFPVFGWYATTLWKDIWMAAFALLFYLCLVEVCRTKRDFFRSQGNVVCLALSGLGLILSKNNGVYMFLLALLVLLLTQKGCRKQIAALFLAGAAFWMVLEGPVYKALGVAKGNVREALSVPMLQMAKVVAADPGAISAEDKALIEAIMPYDDLPELYNPNVSDSIKSEFNSAPLKENLGEYLGLWVRMGLNSPGIYLYSFMEQTYGYWYPEVRYWIFANERYTPLVQEGNSYAVGLQDASRDAVRQSWDSALQTARGWPGLAMLFSVGFAFWVLLAAALYALYTRRWAFLPPMTLFLAVWLICMASPVFAEYRYAYPAILPIPVVLGLTFGTPPPKPREVTE